jgi:hypothetical protein
LQPPPYVSRYKLRIAFVSFVEAHDDAALFALVRRRLWKLIYGGFAGFCYCLLDLVGICL